MVLIRTFLLIIMNFSKVGTSYNFLLNIRKQKSQLNIEENAEMFLEMLHMDMKHIEQVVVLESLEKIQKKKIILNKF